MRMSFGLASIIALVAFGAACTPAAEQGSPGAASVAIPEMGSDEVKLPQIVCGPNGFIPRNATPASLAATYGAENLREETVAWADSEETALVLFPDDPGRRVELFWFGRTTGGPSHVRVNTPDTKAIGPYGLYMGATLADVEAANGGPFELMGFQNHNAGETTDWLGGKLATPDNADCGVDLAFDISGAADPAVIAAVSSDPEKRYRSDSPEMRAANPVVTTYGVGFRQDE